MKPLSTVYCPSAKIRHASEEDAKFSARQGMLRDAPYLTVYHCWQCEGWHLTSRISREVKGKKVHG